ncbi:hypothetical protein CEY04_19635 [Achromobacter sp. HZ28]|nr:hypothetical protein CEY04_19635 [Achromobacter sp. HZ28]OWT76412.1 hypothetical protein CEY05_15085 [Achromobacter sp. HZ34]
MSSAVPPMWECDVPSDAGVADFSAMVRDLAATVGGVGTYQMEDPDEPEPLEAADGGGLASSEQ